MFWFKNYIQEEHFMAFMKPSQFVHLCPDDAQWIHGSVVLVSLHHSYPFYHLHAGVHPSKYRVLAIEPLGRRQGNEELGSVRVGSGIGHREDSSAGVLQVTMQFVAKLCSVYGGSTSTRSSRIAALNHEVPDDSVEDHIIVVAAPGQLGKVPARVGGMFPVEFHGYFAHAVEEHN